MSIDSSTPSSRISSPSPVSTLSDTTTTTSVTASSSAMSSITPFTATSTSSSPPPDLDARNVLPDAPMSTTQNNIVDVDPQILEALKSKDRLFVLKLGEQMEALITERRVRLELTPGTSYQRLLVHRCSSYHRLTIENDPSSKIIAVLLNPESRIPNRRLADLVPPEASSQPAFVIMRRNLHERRKPHSQAGSVAGEDADLSDVEPSESGSLGGRSNTSKKHMTIEEREAAYKEARSRIFMGFDEKDKETDMSANSSTLSLTSGSASSAGDFDDASSLAAESERSSPSFKRDARRSGNNSATSSTSRSVRSPTGPSSGPASSRNSRAPSPSFTFATLYEPTTTPYDTSSGPAYHPQQFYYPYPPHLPPPGQPPNSGFMPPPFHFYPPYPYPTMPPPPPPHHQPQPSADPTSPVHSPEMYGPPPPLPMQYNPYAWHQSHPHPQTMSAPNLSPPMHSGGPSPVTPPPHLPAQSPGPPYPHNPYGNQGPMYSYPVPGYYTPQPSHQAPLPGQHMVFDPQRPIPGLYGLPPGNNANQGHEINPGDVNHTNNHHHRRNGNANGNGAKSRSPQPPTQPKHAWSFGPGVGMSGMAYNNANVVNGSETVGPRLSSMRRLSSNSSNGGFNKKSWDESSSTASSSTSSSSRKTFTSTASSTSQPQHPLPARPDWAVGLKPDNMLQPSSSRHDPHSVIRNNGTMPTQMSPRNPVKHRTPPVLQATDFPPLSSADPNQKRNPVVTGAWSNQSPTRSILAPPSQGNPLVYHPGGPMMNGSMAPLMQVPQVMSMPSRLDEADQVYERPPPKGNIELYNPKIASRRTGGQFSPDQLNGLSDQLNALAVEDGSMPHV